MGKPTWLTENIKWLVGTALVIIGLLFTGLQYFAPPSASDSPKKPTNSQTAGDNATQIQTGDNSPVTVNSGVSPQQLNKLIDSLVHAQQPLNSQQQENKDLRTIISRLLQEENIQGLSILEINKKVSKQLTVIHKVSQDKAVSEQIRKQLQQGKIGPAENLAEKNLAQQKAQMEQSQADTAQAYYDLGTAKYVKLAYKEAFKAFMQAAALAPENGLYLNTAGLVADDLGQYQKAIDYFTRALESDLKTYGEAHPDVAIRRNNLGSAYYALGQYQKAIDYYTQALESDLKTYGEAHPQIAAFRNNLGAAYHELGQYQKAIDYYTRALESDLKTYGEAHRDVARDRNNLGSAYYTLGQYQKAIDYYTQALESDLKTYGETHPRIAATRNNLGSAYKSLGQYQKAIDYYTRALESDLKTYGKAHPRIATIRNNLGGAYYTLGKYTQALEQMESAYSIFLKVFDADHPHTKIVAKKLAEIKEKMQ